MPEHRLPKIVFSPSGKHGQFPVGTPVLQAARELGVDIDSICGGRAVCGRCQVEPIEGNFAKEGIISSPDHLGDLTEDEQYSRKTGQLKAGNRLSCRATILDDIRIDVPSTSQVHQQVVRKQYDAHSIEIDPMVHLYFTQVTEPDLEYPEGDLGVGVRLIHGAHVKLSSALIGVLSSHWCPAIIHKSELDKETWTN